MKNNLKCTTCGEGFFESSYRIIYAANGTTFKTKNGVLTCPKCQSIHLEQIVEEGDFSCSFSKFSSMSNDQKKQMLRERSHKHSMSNPELKSRREHMDRNFRGNLTDAGM